MQHSRSCRQRTCRLQCQPQTVRRPEGGDGGICRQGRVQYNRPRQPPKATAQGNQAQGNQLRSRNKQLVTVNRITHKFLFSHFLSSPFSLAALLTSIHLQSILWYSGSALLSASLSVLNIDLTMGGGSVKKSSTHGDFVASPGQQHSAALRDTPLGYVETDAISPTYALLTIAIQ